jgi:hypothetical protein
MGIVFVEGPPLTKELDMNTTQALEITTNALRVDAALRSEPVSLNRTTFWLSELSYGRKHMGDTLSMAGSRDIVRTAAETVEGSMTAAQLVKAAA